MMCIYIRYIYAYALTIYTYTYSAMKVDFDGIQKERDFYFEKLREIEVLLQDIEDKGEGTDLTASIFKILYATAEGFEPSADPIGIHLYPLILHYTTICSFSHFIHIYMYPIEGGEGGDHRGDTDLSLPNEPDADVSGSPRGGDEEETY